MLNYSGSMSSIIKTQQGSIWLIWNRLFCIITPESWHCFSVMQHWKKFKWTWSNKNWKTECNKNHLESMIVICAYMSRNHTYYNKPIQSMFTCFISNTYNANNEYEAGFLDYVSFVYDLLIFIVNTSAESFMVSSHHKIWLYMVSSQGTYIYQQHVSKYGLENGYHISCNCYAPSW